MTTQALKTLLYQEEMDEAIIVLLTISHDDLTNPIRVCSDNVDVESNGNTFIAFPFEIELPQNAGDEAPRAKLQIDNVDRSIITIIRSITTKPTVTIEIVRSGDLDTIENTFPDFSLQDVTYDALTVSGILTLEEFLYEPYPADIFDPARFPGGF